VFLLVSIFYPRCFHTFHTLFLPSFLFQNHNLSNICFYEGAGVAMTIPKTNLLAVLSISIEDFEKAKKGSDYMGDVFVIYKLVTT